MPEGTKLRAPKKILYRVEKDFLGALEPNARGAGSAIWFPHVPRQRTKRRAPKKTLYRVEESFFGALEPNARGAGSGVWFRTQRPANAPSENRDVRIPC